MNAEEIALEFEQYLKEIEEQPWGNHEIYLSEAIVMLRQLQKERDLLFSAHSHEMVRADKLAVENEELKADNFTLAQTVSELTTIRGSSTLVPDDKLKEMRERLAHLEKMIVWYQDITMTGTNSQDYENGFWDAVNFVKQHQLGTEYGHN